MPKLRGLASNSAISLADQIILSGLNFVITFIFIRYAPKDVFGLYSQFFAGGFFAMHIYDALINNPVTTQAPGLDNEKAKAFLLHGKRLQLHTSFWIAIVFAAITAIACYLYVPDINPITISLCYAAYIFSIGLREYLRSVLFINHQVTRVLAVDTLYATVITAGLGWFIYQEHIDIEIALLLVAIGNVTTAGYYYLKKEGVDLNGYHESVKNIWTMARWALPGSMTGWATNWGYVFIVGAMLGLSANADIQAIRVFIMPITMMVVAGSRVIRPMVSKWLQQGDYHQSQQLLLRAILAMELLAFSYAGLLIFAFPWLQEVALGDKYSNIDYNLLYAWCLFIVITTSRWVGTSWLTSYGSYQLLFKLSVTTLTIALIGTVIGASTFGAAGAILGLCLAELFETCFNLFYAVPKVHKEVKAKSDAAIASATKQNSV